MGTFFYTFLLMIDGWRPHDLAKFSETFADHWYNYNENWAAQIEIKKGYSVRNLIFPPSTNFLRFELKNVFIVKLVKLLISVMVLDIFLNAQGLRNSMLHHHLQTTKKVQRGVWFHFFNYILKVVHLKS